MELNREQEQITNANNDLYEYVKRIVAAVKYKGGCDHEDVPSILREFAEGYEQKIKELTEENERLTAQAEMWKSTAYCEKDRADSIETSAKRYRGKWIVTERGCVISCSNCGYRLELCYPDGTEVRSLSHCPSCGAKIDGERREE